MSLISVFEIVLIVSTVFLHFAFRAYNTILAESNRRTMQPHRIISRILDLSIAGMTASTIIASLTVTLHLLLVFGIEMLLLCPSSLQVVKLYGTLFWLCTVLTPVNIYLLHYFLIYFFLIVTSLTLLAVFKATSDQLKCLCFLVLPVIILGFLGHFVVQTQSRTFQSFLYAHGKKASHNTIIQDFHKINQSLNHLLVSIGYIARLQITILICVRPFSRALFEIAAFIAPGADFLFRHSFKV